MKVIEELGHTADKGIHIEADTREELFEAAVTGMARMLKEDSAKGKQLDLTEKIEISAQDLTSLLIKFLSEVLTLSDIQNALFTELEIDLLQDHTLKGRIRGYREEHIEEDIKAVTYHQADVRQTEDGRYQTNIIFDI